MREIEKDAFIVIDGIAWMKPVAAAKFLDVPLSRLKLVIEHFQVHDRPEDFVIRHKGRYYFSEFAIEFAAEGAIEGIPAIEFSTDELSDAFFNAEIDAIEDEYVPPARIDPPINKPINEPIAPPPPESLPYFEMPPVKTSLFGAKIAKTLDTDKDFYLLDGRAILKIESAAEFFDMSVDQIEQASRFIEAMKVPGIVKYGGRYYIASGEAMHSMFLLSPYRETKHDPTFFYQLFPEATEEMIKDLNQPKQTYVEPDRSKPNESASNGNFAAWIIVLIVILLLLGNG